MGSRAYSIIELIERRKSSKDFNEMMLHHILTITLMLFSYFTNGITFGVIILIMHDIGDWVIKLAFVGRDLLGGASNLFMVPIIFYLFMYLRVIYQFQVLSIMVPDWYNRNLEVHTHPQFTKFRKLSSFIYDFKLFMMFVLWFLNLFWSLLIIRGIVYMIIYGK